MNWYCVHVKPKKEPLLAHYLEESLGLEVFLPRVKVSKVIRRVRKKVSLPMFPRYLFCRFDLAESFRAVRYSPDSLGLVSCSGLPVPVKGEVVEILKEQEGELLVSSLFDDSLKEGDQVQVLDGPLQGMMGTVLKDLSQGSRVAILLSLLNCDAKVVIPRSLVSTGN